jgi:hypothetical protein
MDMTTTPGQVSFAARTQTGSRYDIQTSTDLLFTNQPATSLQGDGSWHDFGTWTTDEARRFWRFERTEEALDNL